MNGSYIPEADWKIWRRLSRIVLERYCARVLHEVAQYSQGTDSPHQRYLDLYQHIKQCDKQIALVFDGLGRSNAYESIANAVKMGMVLWDELGELSPETQAVVKLFLG
jgi:hypothetical protein